MDMTGYAASRLSTEVCSSDFSGVRGQGVEVFDWESKREEQSVKQVGLNNGFRELSILPLDQKHVGNTFPKARAVSQESWMKGFLISSPLLLFIY